MAQVVATATFTGAEDSVALTWTAFTGNYAITGGMPVVTDGGGPPALWLTSPSSSGATINTSFRFSGTATITVLDVP